MPLVRPGEDERAGAACGEGSSHLPVEHLRLGLLAVPERVEAELAHEEGMVAGDGLQPGEIGLQPILGFEVHVERDEVEERELEILRGRVVHIRDEPVWILLLDRSPHRLEVALDAAPAEPAHGRGRDLVPKGVAEDRGMTRDGTDLIAHQALEVRRALGVGQVARVLLC